MLGKEHGPRRLPEDRASEVVQVDISMGPGWLLLDLALWHPSQAGAPGQLKAGAAGTTERLAVGMAPQSARALAYELLRMADLLEGNGASN